MLHEQEDGNKAEDGKGQQESKDPACAKLAEGSHGALHHRASAAKPNYAEACSPTRLCQPMAIPCSHM